MALTVECENGHDVGIKKNSADFAVFNGVLRIQCALCKNNGNNVWVDFGSAPTNDVLNITTLGEDKLFTKEMCYEILKKQSYIKQSGVTTDKTYMTLSALKTFVTNIFSGDAGVTTTCSKSTNNNYYPLESEISIVGKQYVTFTPTGPDDITGPEIIYNTMNYAGGTLPTIYNDKTTSITITIRDTVSGVKSVKINNVAQTLSSDGTYTINTSTKGNISISATDFSNNTSSATITVDRHVSTPKIYFGVDDYTSKTHESNISDTTNGVTFRVTDDYYNITSVTYSKDGGESTTLTSSGSDTYKINTNAVGVYAITATNSEGLQSFSIHITFLAADLGVPASQNIQNHTFTNGDYIETSRTSTPYYGTGGVACFIGSNSQISGIQIYAQTYATAHQSGNHTYLGTILSNKVIKTSSTIVYTSNKITRYTLKGKEYEYITIITVTGGDFSVSNNTPVATFQPIMGTDNVPVIHYS